MADEDPNESPGPPTLQLDADDIEELDELPAFPDREEFVQTLEMDSATRNSMTTPSQTVPDQTTERYDVPEQLLEMARRSQTMKAYDDWAEFVAVVDKKGRISLPSSVHRELRGKKIRVRFKVQDD